MAINRQIDQSLTKLTLEQRERHFQHHSYDEDIRQYELMKRGDMDAVAEGERMFRGPNTGSLADDPVLNYKYLFVSAVTMAGRFCMEGGMDNETAYTLSDLYIRKMDTCQSVEEIFALHTTMFRDFTTRMAELLRGRTSFVIAHRLSTIRDADKILYMEHGDILETGTHDELMELNGRYAALYNSQFA